MSGAREWDGHRGAVVDAASGHDVLACEVCGFRHVVPLPSAAELEAVYREEYYTVAKPRNLERAREEAEWSDLVFGDRLETLESLLAGRRRLLDAGCGAGSFLSLAQRRGWRALGVEPSPHAADHCRGQGLDVVQAFLTAETLDALGPFDAVYAGQLLEHLPDPAATVALLAGALEPGGVLCACVPNDYNELQEAVRAGDGREPWWVVPPHHLNFFDGPSLAGLRERAGLEVVAREGSFPLEVFLLMGDDYIGDDELGRRCHERRKRLELALAAAGRNDLKRKVYEALAALGLGREVVVYAVRPGGAGTGRP